MRPSRWEGACHPVAYYNFSRTSQLPNMATSANLDHKATTDRLSNDDIAPSNLEAGPATSNGKLVAPPLVAAMTIEQRIEAEAKMRRKIDTRLLPMIILMYIMNCT